MASAVAASARSFDWRLASARAGLNRVALNQRLEAACLSERNHGLINPKIGLRAGDAVGERLEPHGYNDRFEVVVKANV
jgi:hypothetical protein